MSNYINLENRFKGYKQLFKELLKIIDLVDTNFKQFDGKDIMIASGPNAKFRKASSNFQKQCSELTDLRIFVRAESYSVYLNMDKFIKFGEDGCGIRSGDYFKEYKYIGKVKDGIFSYSFDKKDYKKHFKYLLGVKITDIRKKEKEIEKLKKQISGIDDSIPFCYKNR